MRRHPLPSLLLFGVLCMACRQPLRADYTLFEPYDSLVTEAVAEAALPSCYRFLPLLLTDCDTAFAGTYARGMWALSVPAAHHYGLAVTDSLDERLEPRKATRAAVAYLRDLKDIYADDDTTLLARYAVCCPVLRVSADSLLPALQQIETEYESGQRTSRFLLPLDEVRTEAARQDSIRRAERERKAAEVAEQKAKAKVEPQFIIYRVKSGDYLGRIASRHHVTVSQLMRWNGLTNPDRLREGQKLKIYR